MNYSLSFSARSLCKVTVALPLIAISYCIGASLIYNFIESTSTHCHVFNFLPSISASIGNFAPQKYVWRAAIGLHSAPRFMLAFVHYFILHRLQLAFILNLLEISALLGLSFVASIENFPLHAKFFTTFIITSLLHMAYLLKHTHDERYFIKRKCAITSFCSGSMAVYFYLRHNWYCEHGVYSLFALTEYFFVLSNMLFHYQVAYQLEKMQFVLLRIGDAKHILNNDRSHLV